MKNSKDIFIHKTARVDDGAKIGEGTKIWHFSHIGGKAVIGKGCKLGQNVYIADNVIIGSNVKIQNNVSLYEGAILEDNVFCGPSSVFTNIFSPRCLYPRNSKEFFRKTLVKNGASIGANATIVCGVNIGRNAFIGAGSVVTKDVPDHALFYGNPARFKGWMCECGEKLNFKDNNKTRCGFCKRVFKNEKGKISQL